MPQVNWVDTGQRRLSETEASGSELQGKQRRGESAADRDQLVMQGEQSEQIVIVNLGLKYCGGEGQSRCC